MNTSTGVEEVHSRETISGPTPSSILYWRVADEEAGVLEYKVQRTDHGKEYTTWELRHNIMEYIPRVLEAFGKGCTDMPRDGALDLDINDPILVRHIARIESETHADDPQIVWRVYGESTVEDSYEYILPKTQNKDRGSDTAIPAALTKKTLSKLTIQECIISKTYTFLIRKFCVNTATLSFERHVVAGLPHAVSKMFNTAI